MSGEMPPEWMWPFESELELWFEDVEQARKDKYDPKGSSGSDDDEEVPMMGNEFARELRRTKKKKR